MTADDGGYARKEWFVAVDGIEVGPLDLAEVETRVHAGELGPESLAWRPGMSDWQQLTNVPELAALSTRSAPAPANLPPVQWRSDNALSLSDLVARELTDDAPAAPPESAAPIASHLGLPDLTSLGFGAGQAVDSGWGIPSANDGWAVPVALWPQTRSTAPAAQSAPTLLIAGLGLLIVVLGATVGVLLATRRAPPPVVAPPPAAAAMPAMPLVVPTAVTPTPPAPDAKPTTPATATPTPAAPVATPTPKTGPPRPRKADAPRAAARASEEEDEDLSPQQIFAAVKANAQSLAPCIRAARAEGELQAGPLRLILAWTITPAGNTQNQRLTGPSELVDTTMAGCLAAKMRHWTFPRASEPSTVRNFPLPLTVR
ncbi:MAG: DUF4339 domain-containing protein [Deltaproteobacteria bacterium]|nr:DUF4339 domain-containing protein [Deltaproteobacteria bacterium]